MKHIIWEKVSFEFYKWVELEGTDISIYFLTPENIFEKGGYKGVCNMGQNEKWGIPHGGPARDLIRVELFFYETITERDSLGALLAEIYHENVFKDLILKTIPCHEVNTRLKNLEVKIKNLTERLK